MSHVVNNMYNEGKSAVISIVATTLFVWVYTHLGEMAVEGVIVYMECSLNIYKYLNKYIEKRLSIKIVVRIIVNAYATYTYLYFQLQTTGWLPTLWKALGKNQTT